MDNLVHVDRIVAGKFPGKKIPGFLIRFFQRLIHEDWINGSVISSGREGIGYCVDTIKYLDLHIEVEGLENIPDDGTLYTFASNHPLGGADGVALAGLIGERFGRLMVPVNDFLMYLKPLSKICIPVNKTGRQARELAQQMDEMFRSDNHVLFFPAGACSRLIDGKVQDLPWLKTFVKKSVETGRSIVPVHFIGENSKRFYRVARVCKALKLKFNFAMLLLPDELYRAQHGNFKVIFGKPLPPQTFDESKSAAGWADWLRSETYKLQ